MWGDRWRRPPYAPGVTAERNRFLCTIAVMRPLWASGALDTAYEVFETSGPDGRYDPDLGDERISHMMRLEYNDWYAQGWERFFLLGAVCTDWEHGLYVSAFALKNYVADLLPQQDEPAQLPAPAPDDDADNTSPQRESIKGAIDALWGGSVPRDVQVARGDDPIQRWQKDKGRAVASERTIRRYFAALKSTGQ